MISILLPYRDAAPTIAEAIESVLVERSEDIELVAIDDGSRDESRAIVERIARSDRRVRCVDAGGVGIPRALMCGLAEARGELVGRMDADDVSLPGRFPAQRRALEQDPALAVVGTQVEAFPDVGAGLAAYVAWQNGLLTAAEHRAAIFVESPLCHPSTLARRAALDAVGGWRDGDFPEDYELWLRLDDAGFGLAKIEGQFLRWRHSEGRATFRDPRYAAPRMLATRAQYLAQRLARIGRPFVVWGAGQTGKRLARALEVHGLRPDFFVDIDAHKIGRSARERRIEPPEAVLAPSGARPLVVVAVGARGARDIVRARLSEAGFVEGADFLCAA